MSSRLFNQIVALMLVAAGLFWGVNRVLDQQRVEDVQELTDAAYSKVLGMTPDGTFDTAATEAYIRENQ